MEFPDAIASGEAGREMDSHGKHLQVRGGGLKGNMWDTKALISRCALPMVYGYAFEALLLCILWFHVPGLGTLANVAGWLQIPAIAYRIDDTPPPIAPNGKRDFFVFLFVVQGFIFSLIVMGVRFLIRRIHMRNSN